MITSGKVVSFHYTLKNLEGEVVDQSEADQPLIYLHGAQNIVPGLEIALEGKSIGDELDVTVSPEDGYGLLQEDMTLEMPLSQFEDADDLEVGAQFEIEVGDQFEIATVTDIQDDKVIVDFNHPLAGETLHFSVSIVDIREATASELEHGHAHDGDGHSH